MLKKVLFLTVFCGYLLTVKTVSAQEVIEDEATSENAVTQEEDIVTEEENQSELFLKNEEPLLSPLPVYTWEDFLTNKNCRPLINELATRSEFNELYQNLRVSCMEEKPLAWDYLLNTFRKEKKTLLVNHEIKTNSSYIKYLKALPYLLFDIQNTQPSGNQPSAILDKAEQAIIDHQIDTTLVLIEELPSDWKDELKSTKLLAKRLLQLKEQLYNLNKSEQGDQND